MTNKYAYLLISSILLSSFVSIAQEDTTNHTPHKQENICQQINDSCTINTHPEIYGTLRNYDAELLTNASITLLNEAGDTLQYCKTNEAGYFALPLKKASRYKIIATKDGYRPMKLNIEPKNHKSINLQTLVLRKDTE